MRYSLEFIGKWNGVTKKNLVEVGCRVLGHWGLYRFVHFADQEQHITKNQKQYTDINQGADTQDKW
jgi:hypothetical protein